MVVSQVLVKAVRFRNLVIAILITVAGTAWRCSADDLATAPHRVQLSEGETRAIARLRQLKPPQPAPLFLFTDPNKDPDDLSVLVITKYLHEQGFIDLRCAITTLGNQDTRRRRAEFTKTVLDSLGQEGVSVGVGEDYSFEVKDANGVVDAIATEGRMKDHQVFIEPSLPQGRAVAKLAGLAMLKQELSQVPDHAAVLLINSGMVDVAALLRESPELVKQKTAKVVIMGGVESLLDTRGFVVADKRAYNNTTDQPSADYTYTRAQELGVPLVVVSKEAAYAAAAPRSFYDGVAATNHPVGIYLKNQQMKSLHHLWDGICKGQLPPALTAEWFFQTFTDVDLESNAGKAAIAHAKAHAEDFASIWNQVSKLNLYDPLALLAATPGAAELLFHGEEPEGVRANVRLIGKNSITDSALVKDLLAALATESLNPPMRRKSRIGTAPGYPPRQHVEEQDAPWTKSLPNYRPPEYTATTVLQHEGDWADPQDVRAVKRRFLTRTSQGEVAVLLDEQGRPLNPLGRTGLRGRGLLGRWGRNQAGDPLLTRLDPESGRLQLLVIQRKDSGQQALPGGMVDEGEEIADTVARELHEETGANLDFKEAEVLFTGVVDDPRNTDNAWMETTVLHKHLTAEEQSTLMIRAGDDARAVDWVDVDRTLLASMYASHADYVRLALTGFPDLPAIAEQANELHK
jgi:ADP-ribose pyrophosphatase YjhB (NUDIX family)/inosine-uridine nucleoside N-ribohydrolase